MRFHLLLAKLWATAFLPFVTGHGVEVRICQTPEGTTRFFVDHWHGTLSSPSQAGTMTIQFQDQIAGTTAQQTQYPDGMINDRNIYSLPNGWGCVNDATPTVVGSSCWASNSASDDWVYFDYSTSCDRPVQYTLLAGNTCYLEDGCGGNLYPAASGWFSASDSTPPIPQVNGNALPYTVTVTADNVGDTSAAVSFTPGAVDDCDANPSVTVSHPSGSSFPVGSTDVTVIATDESGRSAAGTFTVTVIARTGSPTNSPTLNPTNKPTSHPTPFPTNPPTPNPTNKPTNHPTLSPSSKPSVSSSPSGEPSAKPSESPSTSPSSTPSESPSSQPSLTSSEIPSSQPSVSSSNAPSLSIPPSNAPSGSPSDIPSMHPSIVVQTVTTSGSLSTNQDFCSMGAAEQASFKDASIATIRSFACPDPNDDTCSADITSACGSGRRRELSYQRQLQGSDPWQLEYEVVNSFTCATASCSSPSDLSSATQISRGAADALSSSMSSGSFLSLLSTNLVQTSAFDASIVTCLVVWGTTEAQTQTEVGSGGTGRFYPDWEGDSGTCLQDGAEPTYTTNDPTLWLSDSLVDCCLRFYQWDTNSCLNVGSGSGLWYVDPLTSKCVTDCPVEKGETCGGLANVFSDRLYTSPRSCCEQELQWRLTDFCEAESFVSSCYSGTGLYYRGDSAGSDVCVRDCDPANGDRTCGGLVEEDWVVLYGSPEECCSTEYVWIDTDLCADRTTQRTNSKYWADKSGRCFQESINPTKDLSIDLYDSIEDCCDIGVSWLSQAQCLAASGVDVSSLVSNSFYIQGNNCVQDCEGTAPCGGLAEQWDIMFDNSDECCAELSWVARRDCVLSD